MNLRPYQERCFNDIWSAIQTDLNVLLSAACSSGKTVIFSKIIQRLLSENPTFRALILVDREILVTQSRDKLVKAAPELMLDIGIVCASVSDDKTLHKRVTIASRQSLTRHLGKFAPVQLTIVDEVHMMAMPRADQTEPPDQFGEIITTLRVYNPRMRLLGVTATPYRLGDGYIYSNKNVKGSLPYFEQIHHEIKISALQAEGYLTPLIGKTVVPADMGEQLNNIGQIGGEYNLGRLADLMERSIHINSAVEAWKEYCSDRKKTLAFCVTIEHAEKLAAAFNIAGVTAVAIHSQLDDLTNWIRMEELNNGDTKVFVSVAKLTTGMDVPDIDCILLARPTKSASLYKQILGRGARIADGKVNCYVLDMVGMNTEFGTDLDNLKVRYRMAEKGDGEANIKICPSCGAELHPAVRICYICQYEFPKTQESEANKPDMMDAVYGIKPPEVYPVTFAYPEVKVAKSSGKTFLQIRLEMDNGTLKGVKANMGFFFVEDGYTGYAVSKSQERWHQFYSDGGIYPPSAEVAYQCLQYGMNIPTSALVDCSGKWPEIKALFFEKEPFVDERVTPQDEYDDVPF